MIEELKKIFSDDSEIYRNRGFQRRIGFGKRPALINIDLANAWTRPGNAFTCEGMDVIIPSVQQLLAAARTKGIPVIYTSTAYAVTEGPNTDMGLWHYKIPTEVLKLGTEAVEIDSRIAPDPGEQVIVKKRASAFHGTHLAGFLRAVGVDTVILTGVTMAGCVRHSTEDAIAEERTLRLRNPFMQGEDVRQVQKALVDNDIVVDVDGVFGPGAKAGVVEYQEKEGLAADGIVGSATRSRLGIDV